MRIISGTHKGRRFNPPKSLPVRPTTDFAKEGLFNVLRNQLDIEDCSVLDLCSGTGNIALEFASRGAGSILCIDNSIACIKYVEKVSSELDLTQIKTIKADLFRFIDRINNKYDIVFTDPPYEMERVEEIPDLLLKRDCLNENGFLILEHKKDHSFEEHSRFQFKKKYGNVNFSFFQ